MVHAAKTATPPHFTARAEKKGSFILSPEKRSWAPVHNGGSVAKGRHESERVQEYSDVGGTTLSVTNFKL